MRRRQLIPAEQDRQPRPDHRPLRGNLDAWRQRHEVETAPGTDQPPDLNAIHDARRLHDDAIRSLGTHRGIGHAELDEAALDDVSRE